MGGGPYGISGVGGAVDTYRKPRWRAVQKGELSTEDAGDYWSTFVLSRAARISWWRSGISGEPKTSAKNGQVGRLWAIRVFFRIEAPAWPSHRPFRPDLLAPPYYLFEYGFSSAPSQYAGAQGGKWRMPPLRRRGRCKPPSANI